MFVTGKMSQKQGSAFKTYHSGALLPVMTAAELFSSSRHQGLLRQLRGMIFIEDDDYEKFYESTLNNFAEFVQVMPTVVNGPLSHLLNEGLSRATIAVKNYMAESNGIDPLVMYAIFTAALFRDVSHVITNHKVVLCEEDGRFIDEWHPFTGSMTGKAEFYKLYPLAPIYQRLDNTLTPLLARQLMPEEGFLWITSDLQLYADWLDYLSGEDGQGGSVSHGLSTVRPQDVLNLMNALVQVPVEMKQGDETKYGDMFYAWLKESISKGEIAVNAVDSGVYMTVDGVFLERNKIFHHFAEQSKLGVNMNVVFTQFGNLFGIASKGGSDFMNAQYFSEFPTTMNDKGMAFSSPLSSRQRSLREGMVLGDPAMIFMNAQIPATTDMLKSLQPKTPTSHQVPTQTSSGPSNKLK
jgi:hypothetical protein